MLDHGVLRQTILPYVQKGFWGADLTGLKDRLLQLSWVADASVQRNWPDSLVIKLTEQKPVARFGADKLLNSQGDLFAVAPTTVPPGLPLFIGSVGQQKLMVQMYQQMTALLAPIGFKISSLELDIPRRVLAGSIREWLTDLHWES